MDKTEVIKIAQQFAEVISSQFHPIKIYLYGSYAYGTPNLDSDIDIAIIVKSLNKNYLESLTLLYQLRRKVNQLIEPKLFLEGKDPSGFLNYIEKHGIAIT